MSDCLFCKISSGKTDTELIYEDEKVVAFEDINPKAPVHMLIVPKKHISTLNNLKMTDKELIGHIYQVAAALAEKNGIAQDGYRIVSNCNEDGGQTVFHVHFHLLGGRQLQWPPG
ncbi:MAG TPA: histidine triad nucleotide-binding protein [Halanaerobiales bacterium]|nr:histidine triad nucleotide-binding protein [Halanaerobiales bacterium]